MRVRDGISWDLIRCANDALVLSGSEKQALLREASTVIHWYQALLAISGEAATDPRSDIAARLDQFADDIDFRYADEMKTIVLEAAGTIRILRLMLGIRPEIIDEPF